MCPLVSITGLVWTTGPVTAAWLMAVSAFLKSL